jgi:hypothetical protein
MMALKAPMLPGKAVLVEYVIFRRQSLLFMR